MNSIQSQNYTRESVALRSAGFTPEGRRKKRNTLPSTKRCGKHQLSSERWDAIVLGVLRRKRLRPSMLNRMRSHAFRIVRTPANWWSVTCFPCEYALWLVPSSVHLGISRRQSWMLRIPPMSIALPLRTPQESPDQFRISATETSAIPCLLNLRQPDAPLK